MRHATPEERDQALAMVAAGWSITEMVQATGRSKAWVMGIRLEHRTGARPTEPWGDQEIVEVRRLTELGYSAVWIAWIVARDPVEITRLRAMRRWVTLPGQPRRTHHPPVGGMPWGQWSSQTNAAKQPRTGKAAKAPARVRLPVIPDTDEPLPVREDRWERAADERDPWCRRAWDCLTAAERAKWPGMSCRACSINGTDQEEPESRLRTLALTQAIAPEVGSDRREQCVAASRRWREKQAEKVAR